MVHRVTRNHRVRAGFFPLAIVAAACLALPSASSAAAIQVSAGYDHSCALLQGGTVTCWGSNQYGQLGDGTTSPRTGPVIVTGVSSVKELVTGWQSSCALLENTTVKCWGHNDKGQLGDGTFVDRPTPVAVYRLTGATDIASGWQHRCVIVASGGARCWGRNDARQLGIETRVAPFAENKPIQVPNLSGVTRIALGFQHSCALQSAGTVKCWGLNSQGQLGDGQPINLSALSETAKTVMDGSGPLTGVTGLESGIGNHTCVVTGGGSVKCWGLNANGELGDGTTTTRSSTGTATTSSPVSSIALGWEHSCVVIDTGSIECWGWNRYGQLGDGTRANRVVGTRVPGISSSASVASGFGHTCAIATGGRVYCWGRNDKGQIGAISSDLCAPPTPPKGPAPTPLPCSLVPAEVPNMVDPPKSTSQPPAVTLATTATIAFTGESGAIFECSTDGSPFEACTARVSLSGLTAGKHTFKVRQVTDIGTSNPLSLEWTVDLTPPAAPRLTRVPAGVNNDRAATISFTGEPGATFTCSLDDGPDYPCSSPTTITGASDGRHTIEVTQTDVAGNKGPTAAAIWKVDTVGPALAGKVKAAVSRGDTVLTSSFDPLLGRPAKLEWTTDRSRPSASSRPARGRVLDWAPRLVVRDATGLRWVRVGDRIGNWSGWVRVG